MAVLGPRFCARAFSNCGKRGPLFIAVRGPLTIVASLVTEHRLQMHRLSNCGSRAQLLRGMWDPPRPGLEPVSPALAGGLPTTAPPGKPPMFPFWLCFPILESSLKVNIMVLCYEGDEKEVGLTERGGFPSSGRRLRSLWPALPSQRRASGEMMWTARCHRSSRVSCWFKGNLTGLDKVHFSGDHTGSASIFWAKFKPLEGRKRSTMMTKIGFFFLPA